MTKLDRYNKKRNFDETNEPEGKTKRTKQKRFVIHHHLARREHYDFRLEFDGVLVSFAVPKGLSGNPKDKRLAVHVEDHPVSYIDFEGIIPEGNYGAGKVEIYDSGTYSALTPIRKGLNNGRIKIELNGKKLNGIWSLVRTNEPNWLIIKADEEQQEINMPKNPFSSCKPKLCTLTSDIPKKDYIFEIKYDGYRVISYIQKTIKLKTRNDVDYTSKFSSIVHSLKEIHSSMILDGEVVVFDKNGRSDFSLLTESIKNNKKKFSYVVFDILALDGKDLREKSLLERKKLLQKMLQHLPKNIILSSFVDGKGKESFELAKKLNLEGIVAKKKDSKYNGNRDNDWLKIKCYKRQEFVVCGYTTSKQNPDLSAIIVGYYIDKKLVYAGKVGTGFDQNNRLELSKTFKKLEASRSLFDNLKLSAKWLTPKLVAEIKFAEFTKDGVLRQPSFVSLRLDKRATDVVLEEK